MIANLYAEAFFKQATKENILEDMIEQFDRFVTAAKDNPDWIILLDTTTVRNKVKQELLEKLDIFDKTFINFIMIIIKNHHITQYLDIFEQWSLLTRNEQKIAYVNLYTAKKLTKKGLDQIRSDIEDFFPGMEIEFRIQIDESLIRGIKITYQGRSIDRSLKKTIEDMKSNI